jgi:lipoate-protein ligase A
LRLLDISFSEPADNLAFDEVILNGAEDGRTGETLRFWESPELFVVLGIGQARREEVLLDACARDGVPVMRRCTAGGCVILGPGCLNFTLVLKHEHHPELRSIRRSYAYILGLLAAAFDRAGLAVVHEDVSDLAIDGKKVSGNAQRRLKTAILHQGTLLHGLDPALMKKYLREPGKRPTYRAELKHTDFVGHLPMDATQLRDVAREAFAELSEVEQPEDWELDAARELAREKYATAAWCNRR